MSKNYPAVAQRVLKGVEVFRRKFAAEDDYGYGTCRWRVYRIDQHTPPETYEFWLQGSYNEEHSFARFDGVPDLEKAKEAYLGEALDSDALVPSPGTWQLDNESAVELFGCGIIEESYEHNTF